MTTTVALGGCFFGSTPPPQAPYVGASTLQFTIASAVPGGAGHVAVTILHLGTGERASIEGNRRMPMMSVFKLPLAIVALAMVEEGTLALDQKIPITESELRPTHSPIADAWKNGQREPTLETMLVRVIQDSDNTVGDKLVTLEGGGPAITAKLRSMGLDGIDIAEQEIEIDKRLEAGGNSDAAIQHEIDAPPNSATSDALVHLLEALEKGTILSKRSRDWLHEALAGTNTGKDRIKGWLPPGTRVEHKTGTGERVTNDIGIVTLPGGQRFAIAVLTSGDGAKEEVIAKIAKTAWDRFASAERKAAE